MRRVLTTSALVVILAAGSALAGQGGEEHAYDAQGRYQWRTTPDAANPGQQSVYTRDGKYVGRIMTSPDGSSRVYDQHGRYMGRKTGGQRPETPKP